MKSNHFTHPPYRHKARYSNDSGHVDGIFIWTSIRPYKNIEKMTVNVKTLVQQGFQGSSPVIAQNHHPCMCCSRDGIFLHTRRTDMPDERDSTEPAPGIENNFPTAAADALQAYRHATGATSPRTGIPIEVLFHTCSDELACMTSHIIRVHEKRRHKVGVDADRIRVIEHRAHRCVSRKQCRPHKAAGNGTT